MSRATFRRKLERAAPCLALGFFAAMLLLALAMTLIVSPTRVHPRIALLGLLVSATAAWPLRRVYLNARTDRRLAAGLCPCCGYDVRGNSGRCPECGEQV